MSRENFGKGNLYVGRVFVECVEVTSNNALNGFALRGLGVRRPRCQRICVKLALKAFYVNPDIPYVQVQKSLPIM